MLINQMYHSAERLV